MDDRLATLRLLQLADSGFPTGGFSFSHGLEGLHAAKVISNADDVAAFVSVHLDEGFAGIECPAMFHAWQAARLRDLAALVDLDRWVEALKPVPAFRQGSVKTGRRLIENAATLLGESVLDAYRHEVNSGNCPGHHAVAYGAVMEAAGVDEWTGALALGAGYVNALAAAAVRLGAIGQNAAQRIVAAHHPAVVAAVERGRSLRQDEMGAYMPMVDIAGLSHPHLAGRLFAS